LNSHIVLRFTPTTGKAVWTK